MADISRRDFFRCSVLAGTGLVLASKTAKALFKPLTPDISVVSGNNYYENTLKAIEGLGGIENFVKKGSKVGLLVNFTSQWTRPATYVNPDVVLAVLSLLNKAEAGEIKYLVSPMKNYFKKSNKSAEFEGIIDSVKTNSGEFVEVEIPKGIVLKKASVIKDLISCDVFINIAINKHHSSTMYTNILKNYMGACSSETNKTFHSGPKSADGIENTEYMAQCIADVNLIRKPDLCISDATEVLKTNGPFGPGEIIKPHKVFAGTDPVAMDSYGCTLLDYRPQDIRTNVLSEKNGIGTTDLKKIKIIETNLQY